MARYHDYDSRQRGPAALARFLGLRVNAVFPITYDIRKFSRGNDAALAGTIQKEPVERLTRAQVIGLAVPRRPQTQ
jgi:hypothetical protein